MDERVIAVLENLFVESSFGTEIGDLVMTEKEAIFISYASYVPNIQPVNISSVATGMVLGGAIGGLISGLKSSMDANSKMKEVPIEHLLLEAAQNRCECWGLTLEQRMHSNKSSNKSVSFTRDGILEIKADRDLRVKYKRGRSSEKLAIYICDPARISEMQTTLKQWVSGSLPKVPMQGFQLDIPAPKIICNELLQMHVGDLAKYEDSILNSPEYLRALFLLMTHVKFTKLNDILFLLQQNELTKLAEYLKPALIDHIQQAWTKNSEEFSNPNFIVTLVFITTTIAIILGWVSVSNWLIYINAANTVKIHTNILMGILSGLLSAAATVPLIMLFIFAIKRRRLRQIAEEHQIDLVILARDSE